ncbi:MAG: WYL domain-containing protein [Microbacteriaceae bacterium]|nr:WYL domain-containing protein [Microbacteriaceae bacterium]
MPEERSVGERLLNLVYALAQTKIGLTKNDILSVVEAYSNSKADKTSIERMFERDKEILRDNGINITVFEPLGDDGNNQDSRYLISQEEVTFPAEVTFDAKEMALLNLAASAWNNAGQSKMLGSALFKLKALGQSSEEHFFDVRPQIPIVDKNFFEIESAIEENREITFTYLKPGASSVTKRRLRPEALLEFDYRWHVFGIDLSSEKPRTFLLSRIVGEVKKEGTKFVPSIAIKGKSAAEFALEDLARFADQNTAILKVQPHSRAVGELKKHGLRFSGNHDSINKQVFDVPAEYLDAEISFVDSELFADELASFGPEVIVLEPAMLREAVIARLQIVNGLHDGASDGGE